MNNKTWYPKASKNKKRKFYGSNCPKNSRLCFGNAVANVKDPKDEAKELVLEAMSEASQQPEESNETKCPPNTYKGDDGNCHCPTTKGFVLENNNKDCVCNETIQINGKCKPDESQNEADCPDWKKHKAFGPKGRVHSAFCNQYASNNRACKKSLAKIKALLKEIAELSSEAADYKKKMRELRLSAYKKSSTETEASALCFDCLKKVMHASRPTPGQNLGNIFNVLAGAGMGLIGYRAGQRAQYDLNMMRMQQGYEAQNDHYPLIGAKAGLPFMAQGIYGMTRANTPVGGWSCSPTMSPYGHSYNYQYGQGYNMGYY